MKKRVTSGWVLSFSSEEALLQAVRTLVKEEGVFWVPGEFFQEFDGPGGP